MATQTLAEGVWIGKWHTEQREAWPKQVIEGQMWRHVRRAAGAVEGEVRIDMRYVCPKDVKTLLLQQARSTHWKNWAAKHEYEELKEGV